jgi:hypothetical protein
MSRGYRSWFQDLINVWTMPATMSKNKVMYRQFIHSVTFVNWKCVSLLSGQGSYTTKAAIPCSWFKHLCRTYKVITVLSFHSIIVENLCLLVYNTVSLDSQFPVFWRILVASKHWELTVTSHNSKEWNSKGDDTFLSDRDSYYSYFSLAMMLYIQAPRGLNIQHLGWGRGGV